VREKQTTTTIAISALLVFWMVASLNPAIAQYVHPAPPLQASDFPQPPNNNQFHWLGPAIRPVDVKCWSAQPAEPSKFLGGVHGIQQVNSFVPTSDLTLPRAQLDTSFRQTTLASFSGGGKFSDLKPEDLPPGIFVSFKGHPILKVTSVQYPIQDHDPPLIGPVKTGVKVTADFMHEPRMGECYLYEAIWVAVK
jgi:hypothetical protein